MKFFLKRVDGKKINTQDDVSGGTLENTVDLVAKKRMLLGKKVFIIAASLLGLVLLSALVFVLVQKTDIFGNLAGNSEQEVGCSSPDTIHLLENASTVLDYNRAEELKPIADEIVKVNGYEADPNCLYVLATYAYNTQDTELARDYYDKLTKVYKPEVGFAEELSLLEFSYQKLGNLIQINESYEENRFVI